MKDLDTIDAFGLDWVVRDYRSANHPEGWVVLYPIDGVPAKIGQKHFDVHSVTVAHAPGDAQWTVTVVSNWPNDPTPEQKEILTAWARSLDLDPLLEPLQGEALRAKRIEQAREWGRKAAFGIDGPLTGYREVALTPEVVEAATSAFVNYFKEKIND